MKCDQNKIELERCQHDSHVLFLIMPDVSRLKNLHLSIAALWRVFAKFHLNLVLFFKSRSGTKRFIQLGHVGDISLVFTVW